MLIPNSHTVGAFDGDLVVCLLTLIQIILGHKIYRHADNFKT